MRSFSLDQPQYGNGIDEAALVSPFMFIAVMPSSNTFLLLLTGLYPEGQSGMHPMRDRLQVKLLLLQSDQDVLPL